MIVSTTVKLLVVVLFTITEKYLLNETFREEKRTLVRNCIGILGGGAE